MNGLWVNLWANLGLLILAVVCAGLLWFILYILGTAIFEDFLGRIVNKFKSKPKEQDEDDYYVY